jgi:hypothetical protein
MLFLRQFTEDSLGVALGLSAEFIELDAAKYRHSPGSIVYKRGLTALTAMWHGG